MQPFSYFGGKYRLRHHIYPFFPAHNHFVDVFGGSGAVLLGKERSNLETYNDINETLVGFFRVLQNEVLFDTFYRRMLSMPHSKELFNEYRDTWHLYDCPVEKYVRWYTLAVHCFGARFIDRKPSWAYRIKGNQTSRFGRIEELPQVVERLRSVQIDNEDHLKIFERYDAPETFFYLDPPYVPSTRLSGEYKHEMRDADHEKLVDVITALEGKVMLSGYDNPIYDRLDAHNWQIESFEVKIPSPATDKNRLEIIWMNYDQEATQLTLL